MSEPKAKTPVNTEAFRSAMTRATGVPFTEGNAVEPLRNGDAIFPAMLAAIDATEREIAFLTFVYWRGPIARRFAAALARAARRGVTVRVLLDAFGSRPMRPHVLRTLVRSGVTVRTFRPLLRVKLWQNNNRTHRKILVCDRAHGFTGGVGIAQEWIGDARNADEWRDTHFGLRGPVVDALHAAFVANWVESLPARKDGEDGDDIPGAIDALVGVDVARSDGDGIDAERTPAPEPTPGSVAVQTVASTASVRWSEAFMMTASAIRLAQRSLHLTTAYLAPGPALTALLTDAVSRGVRVRVLVPGEHADKRIARYASHDAFGPLLRAGVEVYCFAPAMLHAKLLVIDGRATVFGSANFNQRSMQKDDEVCLVAVDEQLAATLDRDFEHDLDRAVRIDPERWRRRPWTHRALEKLTRLVRPEL